jgi:hypothetical protein
MSCEPPVDSLSIVLHVVPLLQNVNPFPVVASQNIRTRSSVDTSTEVDAVSLNALPAPMTAGRSVLIFSWMLGKSVIVAAGKDVSGTLGITGDHPKHAAPGPENGQG